MSVPAVLAVAALGLLVGVGLEVVVELVPRRASLTSWSVRDLRPRRALALCVLTGTLFALTAARVSSPWELPALLLLAAALVALSAIDLEHFLLPNRLVYPTAVGVLVLLAPAAAAEHAWPAYGRAVLAGLAALAVMTTMALVSPHGMGMGDAKLAGVVGLAMGWLGWGHLLTGLFLAFVASAVTGLVLVLTRHRRRHDALAFGPFLALGSLVVLLG